MKTHSSCSKWYYFVLSVLSVLAIETNSLAQTTTTAPSVVNFTLINADTDQPVSGFDPIPEGAVINFNKIGTSHLNIRANTNPSPTGSVKFGYDGNAAYRTESYLPYALAGDSMNGDYYIWTPALGSHTLTAIPYSAAKATGTAGSMVTLHFSIADWTAPSVPTGLTSSSITSSSFKLAWTAATDNVGVTAYDVSINNGTPVRVTGTSYSATGLKASTVYSSKVRACDAAGNVSAYSSSVSVTTAAAPVTTSSTPLPWIAKRTFYISNSGNDSNPGTTQDKPWRTIAKVNSYLWTNAVAGDWYLFKRGETFKGPLQAFKKAGTSSDRIVFADYGTGDRPEITMFKELTSWTLSSTPGVYYTTWNYEPKVVSFDDALKGKGRYPKTGYKIYNVASGTAIPVKTLHTDPSDPLPDSPSWAGAEIVVRTGGQTIEIHGVSSHSSGNIYLTTGLGHYNNKAGYFFRNHIRALTTMGDWMYKASEHRIYAYFGTDAPSMHSFKVDDQSISTDGGVVLAQNYYVMHNLSITGAGTGVFFKNGQYNLIQDCELTLCHTGSSGNGTAANNVFRANSIHDMANGGIRIINNPNYTFENNIIKNIGMILDMEIPTASGGIAMYLGGDGHVIRGNRLTNIGFTPIYFSNDKVLIEKNYINGFGKVKDDTGGIYCWANSNQNAVLTTRTVRNNIVLNGYNHAGVYGNYTERVHGLYPDSTQCVTFQNNFVDGMPGDPMANVSSSNVIIQNNILHISNPGRAGISMAQSSKHPVFGCSTTGNVVLGTTNQSCVYLVTYGTVNVPITGFGTFANNYYRSSKSNCLRYESTYYTLSQWQAAMGSDSGSSYHQALSTDSTKLLLKYNDTKADMVVDLAGKTYQNLMTKTTVSGSITLKPFESVALLETP